jgi:hypothetical protein
MRDNLDNFFVTKNLRRNAGETPANLKEHRRNTCDPEKQTRPTDRGRPACTLPQGKQKGG